MTAPDERSLSCQRVVELVTDYIEGAMAPPDRDLFERHLDTCPHCVVYLRQMRLTIEAVGQVRSDDFSEPVRDELVAIFRAWKSGQGATAPEH